MGCLLLYPVKRFLTDDNMSDNPSKRMRIDYENNTEGHAVNEDLWGQDDLTAEEFDMLEIQATQSCNQDITHQNHAHNHTVDEQNNQSEINSSKYHLYELEGRVKLLSQSLEKSMKELSEERLNRERILNDRMTEFHKRETTLLKEIEKLQSILEFKDQEMKSTHSKLQVMKSHLQNKKPSSAEISLNKNFEDFLKSSKSGLPEDSCNLNTSKSFSRKHKLSIDTPNGETKSIDIMSSILCTKLTHPAVPSSENTMKYTFLEDSSKASFPSICVVQLKDKQKCDELLEHYQCFLKDHVEQLKSEASKNSIANSGKNSPLNLKCKDSNASTVISFLSDIACVLSAAQSDPSFQNYEKNKDQPCTSSKVDVLPNLSVEALSHNEDHRNSLMATLTEILKSLLSLADPNTYPIGYPKVEEIEFSLSVLLTICQFNPKILLDLDCGLPIFSLLNPQLSVTSLCTTLKLLVTMCSCKTFVPHLSHKNSNCLLCLIGTFLMSIVPSNLRKFSSSVILIEDFLSAIFSIHDMAETHLDASFCMTQVIQGVIKSVWRYYQFKEQSDVIILIIRKGFLLLHIMANCLQNFKERRNLVEDEYIYLITSLAAASKENTEFKDFYDLIHSLWDFQPDTSELDSDELSEEAQASTNEMDVE